MTAAFSPPFPTNPNVGDTFCGWTWNGSMWVCTSAQFVKIQTFLASGPYMPTPGLLGGVAECWGGGGCGGAAQAVGATDMVGGGGGGSGGYSKTGFAAALVRGGVLVTDRRGRHQHRDAAERRGDELRRDLRRQRRRRWRWRERRQRLRLGRSGGHGGDRRRRRARRGGLHRPHSDVAQARRISRPHRRLAGFGRHAAARSVRRRRLPPRSERGPEHRSGRLGGGGQPAGERVWNDALRRQWRLGPVRRDGVYLRRPRRELEPVRVRRAGPRGARVAGMDMDRRGYDD